MNSLLIQLKSSLQQWTPFSVICVILVLACVFTFVWDNTHNIPIPAIIYAVLSALTASTGVTTLIHDAFNKGVTTANGVAKDTAVAVVKESNTPTQEVK